MQFQLAPGLLQPHPSLRRPGPSFRGLPHLLPRAAREPRRAGHSAGLQTSQYQRSSWTAPLQLLRSDYNGPEPVREDAEQVSAGLSGSAQVPLTVYTVRLMTGYARGAAMSEPYSAVNVCLFGADGRAILHRIPPINDPQETQQNLEAICQIVGDDAGADCRIAMSASACSTLGSRPPPAPPKRRFQEGVVDEVSFVGEDLGPLAGLLVGTECGTWYLDEADVVSSRTRHIDRFVCRRLLGAKAGDGASLLEAVPPGAVVYGEGEQAMLLTEEQASALHAFNMSEYESFKARMLAVTCLLIAGGGSLAAVAVGLDAALCFFVGGGAGLVYQWMLMSGVDHMVEASAHGPERRHGAQAQQAPLARVAGSTPARLAFVVCVALAGLVLAAHEPAGPGLGMGPMGTGPVAGWQLLMGVLGFMTYKVAMVSVAARDSVAPANAPLRKKQYEKS